MPKRKATEDADLDISPSKRLTRSGGRIGDEPPPLHLPQPVPVRSSRRTKPLVETQNTSSSSSGVQPLKGRISPRKQQTLSTPNKRRPPKSSKETNGTLPGDSDTDSSDELNISPGKEAPLPVTPPPRPRKRVVMHSVEIRTPAGAFNKKSMPRAVSPVPGTPRARKVDERVDDKLPSTPSSSKSQKPDLTMGKDSPSGKSNPSRPQPSRSRAPGVVSSPASLSKNSPLKPTSPKNNPAPVLPQSPTRLPRVLPAHLIPCLRLQKRAILSAIHDSSIVFNDSVAEEPHTNVLAFEQLRNLLTGTVDRGEGNSCLLLGPRGSGKTQLVEQAIAAIPHRPIILRLSGYAQHNDRLALREIARQLHHQTGKSFLIEDANSEKLDEDDNPFLDTGSSISLPPPSHLPALISLIPTLLRPTIVILDAFDLFASHARQSLLYCLLDTVQSCRVGQSTNGLSVIGVTSRIDAINLLEKRVKSRFSGRMLRVAPPTSLSSWNVIMKRILTTPVDPPYEEWSSLWTTAVDKFQNERVVSDTFQHTFSLTRDVRMLKQILIHVVVGLTASSPFPLPSQLISALAAQRCRIHFPNLHTLSYPSTCLLIAAIHADTAGHDTVNFEMLHDSFRDQFRASASAPVQVEGGSIGMVRCTREVLMSGFEQLLATRMLVPAASSFSNVAPEFIRYRCLVCRQDVKKAVDTIGQTNLKKWLSKAQ